MNGNQEDKASGTKPIYIHSLHLEISPFPWISAVQQ